MSGAVAIIEAKFDSKGILSEYNKIFLEYEQSGITERVPLHEILKAFSEVHCLPHRPVVQNDKETTKIQVVFDASCNVNGPSLNKCLYSGPNLITKIFHILLRFWLSKTGVLADIRQAFLNIGISKEHADYLRFLWYDLTEQGEPINIITYRFLRVVFGVTSSPFLLNGTIRHHLDKYSNTEREISERIAKDLYVDDLISGCHTQEKGKELYDKSKAIMAEAGFDLRK